MAFVVFAGQSNTGGYGTLSGGSGADTFHAFAEAGLDQITDFNFWEGDRLNLLAGSSWTVAETPQGLAVNLSGGAQMLLLGVRWADVGEGWITSG